MRNKIDYELDLGNNNSKSIQEWRTEFLQLKKSDTLTDTLPSLRALQQTQGHF